MKPVSSKYPYKINLKRAERRKPASEISERQALRELARFYRVQAAYYDVFQRRCQIAPDVLLTVLKCLGAPVEGLSDVPDALREHRKSGWQRLIEPVIVAWDGKWPEIELRLPVRFDRSRLTVEVRYENGVVTESTLDASELPALESVEVEGERYVVRAFSPADECPPGYHWMTVDIEGKTARAMIIAAPTMAYWPERPLRTWGFFLPLYALHSQRSWGTGDFTDMEAMMDWVLGQGGGVIATLPLLPLFLENPVNPSPYSPVSRLLWNEFYVDPSRAPEMEISPEARVILESAAFNEERSSLRENKYVDYQRQMRLKRTVLQQLSQSLYQHGGNRLEELNDFAEQHPHALEYARFRATMEARGTPWQRWPEHMCRGEISSGEYDEDKMRYYLYSQWLAGEQIGGLAGKAQRSGRGLYLDFPLGVHSHGYDAWRYQDSLVSDASVGAPPDAVFTRGQDWGMPPMHPEKARERFYQYYIECIRHHLRYSGILRLDHVMGLHRVFMIPHGMEASHGTYTGYPSEELYAILTLESHRNRSIIVGEDLGTVPPYVRPAMRKHGLGRMYVLQYELDSRLEGGLGHIGDEMVASASTHDMPTFKSYWEGNDIDLRMETGLLDAGRAEKEAEKRREIRGRITSFLRRRGYLTSESESETDVFMALLSYFAGSRAPLVLADLEDLWMETEPQNLPGTVDRPNWCRKARYTLEEITGLEEVQRAISLMNKWRGE
ncbi:MAG: 4-alpha-glucanotransferase [Dehalococcoidia bacterium]